jgi:osmoprotectant transport system ATP-binding protein
VGPNDRSIVALDDVSITVPSGTTLVLIGESGCGKSTLLRLFNHLVEPDAGAAYVRGADVATVDAVALRRSIGYVPQDDGLLPHWTVARNVCLVPELEGWTNSRKRERSDELLELVGLEPSSFRDRHPHELSGGQRQRVAFARALAIDPDVVLLDEPFGALDAITRLDLQDEFEHIRSRVSSTMLLVTHDVHEAFRLGDRVAVMRHGRILVVATPDELRAEAPAGISAGEDHAPDREYVVSLVNRGLGITA